METIPLVTRDEYEYAKGRGYVPLLDRRFYVEHDVRVEVQREMFGKGNHQKNNQKFYRWVWNTKKHICEECGRPLEQYSAAFVSHILSRGAHPECAYDPRNVNILCMTCHNRWENGDREKMRIYERNEETIGILKNEYK